jgi:hypothetical protein
VRRLNAAVSRLAALVPESREAFSARVSQGCMDAISEKRSTPLEGAPDNALCYQGGVPCESSARCPVLKRRT